MKVIKYILCGLFVATLFTACHHKEKESYDSIGKSGLTTRTEFLNKNLRTFKDKGVLFGQEYGTIEGVGWKNNIQSSDFKSICDDLPSCIGFELAGVEKGLPINIDSINFNLMRRDILDYIRHGGLITMSWTTPNPFGNKLKVTDKDMAQLLQDGTPSNKALKGWTKKVAVYLGSLQDVYGIKVPVVLSLYPETGKSWWSNISAGNYKELYQQTMGGLKHDGVDNVLFAYTQVKVGDEAVFMSCFPGEGVDVIDFEYIQPNTDKSVTIYQNVMSKMLPMLVNYGEAQNKIIGITTGMEGIPDKHFWTETLLPLIKANKISYLMLGKSYGDAKQLHFCAPYPGDQSVPDFVKMYNDNCTLFMSDVNGLYLDHPKHIS